MKEAALKEIKETSIKIAVDSVKKIINDTATQNVASIAIVFISISFR